MTDGFEVVLNGKTRESPPRRKVLDGEQEAKVIALRLGEPPEGFANWSLRLLANRVVELGIAESVSHETLPKERFPGKKQYTRRNLCIVLRLCRALRPGRSVGEIELPGARRHHYISGRPPVSSQGSSPPPQSAGSREAGSPLTARLRHRI